MLLNYVIMVNKGDIDWSFVDVAEPLPASDYPEGSPVCEWGKLKVAPNDKGLRVLCSDCGEPVQLKGFSSHGLQWSGAANVTSANVKFMKEQWGCNVFRIVVYVNEEGGFFCNPTHLTFHVENAVRWCGENGIYCLIDWHVHNPGNPQDAKYRNCPLSGNDLAATFFHYCAKRFRNQKHVIYELCNEPNSRGEVTVVSWRDVIKPYCEEMLCIVRQYDPDVVVVCGTPSWSQRPQDVIGFEPADRSGKCFGNVMYSFHFYAASHNDGRKTDTDTKFEGVDFFKLFTDGDAENGVPPILEALPIFVTEWGTTDASGWTNFRPDLADVWMRIFDGDNSAGQRVSWCNWSFSAEGGVCAALKWNCGNMYDASSAILSDSGRYVVGKIMKM